VLPVSPTVAAMWQAPFHAPLPTEGDRSLAAEFNKASIGDAEREFYSALARPLESYPGVQTTPVPARFSRWRRTPAR
jgi:hypothetical protein